MTYRKRWSRRLTKVAVVTEVIVRRRLWTRALLGEINDEAHLFVPLGLDTSTAPCVFFCLKYGVVSALACSPRHVVLKPAGIRYRGVLKFERVVAGSCGVQSLDCHAGRAAFRRAAAVVEVFIWFVDRKSRRSQSVKYSTDFRFNMGQYGTTTSPNFENRYLRQLNTSEIRRKATPVYRSVVVSLRTRQVHLHSC
jgi:hypothetical protein